MMARYLRGALLGAMISACAESEAPSTTARAPHPVSVADCERADEWERLEEHACVHAVGGPFRTVDADGYPSSVDVSHAHTGYRVSLVDERRWVKFTSPSSGEFALYSSEGISVDIHRADASPVEVSCASVTLGFCDELRHERRVRLAKEVSYLVGLAGEPSRSPALVIIEELPRE
jgi:hypothetical protein